MRLRAFLIAALLACLPALSGCAQPPPPAAEPPADAARDAITVLTWNLEWFPGGHPEAGASARAAHMAEAQAVLRRVRPDLVLLQEVRDEPSVRELCAAVPGLDVDVVSRFPQRDPSWPQQNIALASTLPPLAAYFEEWRPGRERPPRGFAFAAYELPTVVLLVYSVHLKSNGGDRSGRRESNIAKREEAVRQLRAHLKQVRADFARQHDKPVAVIVGGDWNTSREDGRFKREQTLRGLMEGFHWGFAGVPEEQRYTLPGGRHPPTTFDHFFVRGLGEPTARVLKVPDSISDHRPVLMRVTLPPTEP
ncbi:MAG: endonuclease/exonuclease/phosphatase family protein [Verrucomicrobiota bacterium]